MVVECSNAKCWASEDWDVALFPIEPHGFRVIDIDGVVTKRSVDAAWEIVEDQDKAERWADHNYQLCLKHYSHTVLRKHLRGTLAHLFPDL